jgi:putative intracellular protease/amidase
VDTADRWNVGILIFDGVEVLDFAGPFEVFSRTRLTPGVESRRSQDGAPFQVFTVAKSEAPVSATGDLRVIPH